MTAVIRLLFSSLALFVSAAAIAAQPLVTPAELAGQLGDSRLRIVDIRDGKVEGKTAYEIGHIAGAQHAPYAKWRGPKDSPGKLPPTAALTSLVQQLGIDDKTPVVVVYEGKDSTDFGSAARVYWTLKAAGVPKLSILNGGMTAWRAAGLPVVTSTTARAPSSFQAALDPRLIATRDEVAQVVINRSARLLDTRPATYFAGQTRHTAARTPGTIVGAKNVSHEVWFAKDAQLLPTDDIKRVAQQAGVGDTPISRRFRFAIPVSGRRLAGSSCRSCWDKTTSSCTPNRSSNGRMPDWRWTTFLTDCSNSGCS